MAFRGTLQEKARDLNLGEQIFSAMLMRDAQGQGGGFADAFQGFGQNKGSPQTQDFNALRDFQQSRQSGFTGPPSPFPQLQSPAMRDQFSRQTIAGLDPNQQSLIRQRESLTNQRMNIGESQGDRDISNLLKFSEQKRRLIDAETEAGTPGIFKTEIDLIDQQIRAIQKRTGNIAEAQKLLDGSSNQGTSSLTPQNIGQRIVQGVGNLGGGKKLDDETARQIFEEAGFDPNLATQIARRRGFKVD